MNYLTQLFEQARGMFLSLTPASRVMAGLMLAAIAIGSGFLARDIQTSDMEYLFGGHLYKESELLLAETAMSTAGLRKYERDGLRIRVPRKERDLYIKALADGGATPQQLRSATDKALAGGNVLESMFYSKTRFLEARQQDLASALERLPFVDKVYITYDEKREGFSAQSQSSASILVFPRNNRPLEEQQKRSIMQQVKATFAGLKYENISVMDGSTGLSMNGESDPLNSEQQRYFQQKIQAEQRLKEKAKNLLADYGEVRVEANVELDPTLREESQLLKYGDKPTIVQTTTTKKDTQSSKPVTGGRVGTEPNALSTANGPDSLRTQGEQSNVSKEQRASETMIVGQETTLSEKVGLAIKNASLSVSIPISYYSKAHRREWEEINPGKPVPEMSAADLKQRKEGTQKKIQALLANLLPFSPGEDTRPQIVVEEYLDMPLEAIPSPSLATIATIWLATNWQTIAMFGLAIAVLLSIRSFVAGGGRAADDSSFERGFDIPLDSATDIELAGLSKSEGGSDDLLGGGGSEEGKGGEDGAEGRPRFSTSGADMRSELATIIQENPDIAASLLRDWIGEAA